MPLWAQATAPAAPACQESSQVTVFEAVCGNTCQSGQGPLLWGSLSQKTREAGKQHRGPWMAREAGILLLSGKVHDISLPPLLMGQRRPCSWTHGGGLSLPLAFGVLCCSTNRPN